FGLYFGNDFKNDSVTISIQGKLIAKNVQLKVRMFDPTNLMIEQDNKMLVVWPYGKSKIELKKVELRDSNLQLMISINNIWQNFHIDLNRGKFLYAHFFPFRLGWSGFKLFKIIQWDYPPLIF
ncbi:MAG TPA: hypothetical protein P5158_06225, partial [Chitinophagaceae bacterium]|nr:hypothetical protein [Chitinophagaceae bacterium]